MFIVLKNILEWALYMSILGSINFDKKHSSNKKQSPPYLPLHLGIPACGIHKMNVLRLLGFVCVRLCPHPGTERRVVWRIVYTHLVNS